MAQIENANFKANFKASFKALLWLETLLSEPARNRSRTGPLSLVCLLEAGSKTIRVTHQVWPRPPNRPIILYVFIWSRPPTTPQSALRFHGYMLSDITAV